MFNKIMKEDGSMSKSYLVGAFMMGATRSTSMTLRFMSIGAAVVETVAIKLAGKATDIIAEKAELDGENSKITHYRAGFADSEVSTELQFRLGDDLAKSFDLNTSSETYMNDLMSKL